MKIKARATKNVGDGGYNNSKGVKFLLRYII